MARPKKSRGCNRAKGRRMESSMVRSLLTPSPLAPCGRGAGGEGAGARKDGEERSKHSPTFLVPTPKNSFRGFCGWIDLRDSNRGWYNAAKGPMDAPQIRKPSNSAANWPVRPPARRRISEVLLPRKNTNITRVRGARRPNFLGATSHGSAWACDDVWSSEKISVKNSTPNRVCRCRLEGSLE